MFDRVSQVAEKLAMGMSRRGFLGSVGQWAGALAVVGIGIPGVRSRLWTASHKTCCRYYTLAGCCGSACV